MCCDARHIIHLICFLIYWPRDSIVICHSIEWKRPSVSHTIIIGDAVFPSWRTLFMPAEDTGQFIHLDLFKHARVLSLTNTQSKRWNVTQMHNIQTQMEDAGTLPPRQILSPLAHFTCRLRVACFVKSSREWMNDGGNAWIELKEANDKQLKSEKTLDKHLVRSALVVCLFDLKFLCKRNIK